MQPTAKCPCLRVRQEKMSYSIGDGMVALGLAGAVTSYFYFTYQSRQKRMEIIHQERLIAMEKGIPMPEFPPEPDRKREADPTVLPILGTVLFTLSVGTMVVLYINVSPQQHGFWVAPLPFAFLGAGLAAYHFLSRERGR